MEIKISKDQQQLGIEAGIAAAEMIRASILERGQANVILATGTSQFETLKQLIAEDIDWSKVVMFHLDEYIGLPQTAKASFRKYLRERFLDRVPPLKAQYLIDGENDADAECKRLGDLIRQYPIDVALVGIGENGHLAFNDPPADFETEAPYLVVDLDQQCRSQQLDEGWFNTLEEVPKQAISMSIKQIMKSAAIICSVPDRRKATAIRNCLAEPVDNKYPASILKSHPHCYYYLDQSSASMLFPDVLEVVGER
ncbi:glucosamine-6-phosphate deaminase [Terrimonas sp. NA20]|uniref:Glucosamine-6-phosphate deaminase n=1 Tax=Terrimonas ginsenosidimutans TaxID=2908004 RepID=A0ABS9KSZ6_9BACT|nr:glucosamine-6-phosphate deaminase [Terrimonas ginsenosidimutans]MCG2615462.1 glucosamine-6-phosphate deaminase [Terrimonas ginsenosidimutans]